MFSLTHDLRYATRQLRNSAGFTVAAVLTLALGVGATTAIVAGLAVSLAGGRLINGLLFRTSPMDPISLSITVGILMLLAAFAVIIPAQRAASVNPTEALRAE